jgi:hypothetical protein
LPLAIKRYQTIYSLIWKFLWELLMSLFFRQSWINDYFILFHFLNCIIFTEKFGF